MNVVKSCCWSITAFNEDLLSIQSMARMEITIPDIIKEIYGGLERCPKTGKDHYQGCLITSQCRMSALKKIFPTAHLEPAKKKEALIKYAMKADTAVDIKKKAVNPNYITMSGALEAMARIALKYYTIDEIEQSDDLKYRHLSSQIISKNLSFVSIYSNPQTMRSWKMYYNVFYYALQD